MATINSLQQAVDALRHVFDLHIDEDKQVYRTTQSIQAAQQTHAETMANIQDHVKNLDERVRTQEFETKANREKFQENNILLKSVQQTGNEHTVSIASIQTTVDNYEKRIKNFFAFLKWLATILSLVLASVISTWIISHH